MDALHMRPDCLAAIVYDDGVAIDALLSAFARELRQGGIGVAGIIQLPPDGPGCGPRAPMCVQDVSTGEVIPICQDLGSGAQSCRLDASGLAKAASRLRSAVDRQPDILFVSKFGKQEIQGRGFRAEIAYAAADGRTVLTAVKRGLVHNWLDFTGGVGTLLDHRLWVVRDWWRDVRAHAIRTPLSLT